MAFSETEICALLAVKGIGPTVVQRLQQMGLDDTAKLADILQQGALLSGSSCWKNSLQAQRAIAAAVAWAAASQQTAPADSD